MTHSAILETATLHWPDEAACRRCAIALAAVSPRNAVITLGGDLGAGKTTFTRHLLQALGVQGRIKSPTYAVMESYDVGWPVAHFDFYRFSDPQEWEDAGLRDVFAAPGLKLCEWPAKAKGLMPAADLSVHLSLSPSALSRQPSTSDGLNGIAQEQAAADPVVGTCTPDRQLVVQAYSAEGLRLLKAMVQGEGPAPLASDLHAAHPARDQGST